MAALGRGVPDTPGRAQQATEAVADNSAAAKHQAADGFAYFDSFLATSRSRSLPALPKTCGLQGGLQDLAWAFSSALSMA